MPLLAQFILALAYFLVGCVLSVPYTYLANGNMDNFMLTAWIAPVGTFVLFIAHTVERAMSRRKSSRTRMLGGWFFWSLVTWFCFPIILNGVSLLLNSMGFGTASHYVFEFRYASIMGVPILFIVFCMIASGVESIRERFAGSAKPPSSSPPSDFGPQGPKLITNEKKADDEFGPSTFRVVTA